MPPSKLPITGFCHYKPCGKATDKCFCSRTCSRMYYYDKAGGRDKRNKDFLFTAKFPSAAQIARNIEAIVKRQQSGESATLPGHDVLRTYHVPHGGTIKARKV